MRVLIIDDDPILIMVCTRLMKITGFSLEVSSAKEGREGIDLIKNQLVQAPDLLPDIILLDINMPVMTGWEFLDEFSGMMSNLPRNMLVFMLSSTIDRADYDKAKTYKAVKGFYSKPITVENLSEITAVWSNFNP